MGSVLLVGMGGALGAVGRYGLSLLPWRGDFPLLTLLTNLLGAVLIGFIAGLAGRGRLNASGAIFWKTGVCGGFCRRQFVRWGSSALAGRQRRTVLLCPGRRAGASAEETVNVPENR